MVLKQFPLLFSSLSCWWLVVIAQQCDPVFDPGCDSKPQAESCDPVFDPGCGDSLRSATACDPVFDANCQSSLANPTSSCDPVFDSNCPSSSADPPPDCDPVFDPNCSHTPTSPPPTCFSINDIDSDIFSPDARQAENVCEPGKCQDFADRGYTCAPIWTCKENKIITDGKGIIDVRSTDAESEEGCVHNSGIIDVTDKKCPKANEVCCKNPNYRATKCKEIPTAPKPDKKTRNEEVWESCGRNGTGGLVLTGIDDPSTAQPGEFPHMCVIYRIQSGQRVYVGGASLIAPNKLLTVAHKFWVVNKGETTDYRDKINSDDSEFFARCGEHNVKAEEELVEFQETKVVAIRFHPDYNKKRVTYNLAILITEENFVYQEHIGPVCLPQPDEDFSGQTDCWSSGWGANSYDSTGYFSDTLKKVQMPIVPTRECQDKFQSHERFKGKPFRIHPSWTCVGGEADSDTCKGDGGSPHVCKDRKNRYVQVGAVAWGIGCGDQIPSIYSNVAGSMCWVDWIMSCVPLSDYYIDDSFAGDLRGTGSFKSFNKFTSDQCESWLRNKAELKEQCNIAYEALDERST